MSAPVLRKMMFSAGILAMLVLVAFLLFPLLASTSLIRNRISAEISNWTGYRVVLDNAPEISVFPSLKVVLNGVRLEPWATSGKTVARIDEMTAVLSAWDAVSGNISFSQIELLRPVLLLENGQDVTSLPGGGRITNAIARTRVELEKNPEQPDLSFLPNDRIGPIRIVEGRLMSVVNGKETPVVTSINGTLSWPRLDGPLTTRSTAIWNGENVTLDLTAKHPMVLFSGGRSGLFMMSDSKPLKFSFDGTITQRPTLFVDGDVLFETTSLSRVLEWTQLEAFSAFTPGATRAEGQLTGDSSRIKLSDANLTIGTSQGKGVVEFTGSEDIPALSGTLHFPTLDLAIILNTMTGAKNAETAGLPKPSSMGRLGLDLRLSADSATLDGLTFSQVAATAQTNMELSAFDISDAQAFGGSVQAGFRVDLAKDSKQTEIRFLATDVDGSKIGDAMPGLSGIPDAPATISLILKGPGSSWNDLLRGSAGSLSARFAAGSVPEVDLDKFVERLKTSGFFRLSEATGRPTLFEKAEVELAIKNGFARIQKAMLQTPVRTVDLGGLVPLAGRSLALAGTVRQREQDNLRPPISFFAGGSWSDPLISPTIIPNLPEN